MPTMPTIDEMEDDAPCACPSCQQMRWDAGRSLAGDTYDPDDYPDDDEESEYDGLRDEDETFIREADAARLPRPLLHLLRNGGRRWSAEVEINGMSYSAAARVLGSEVQGYRDDEDSQRNGSVFSTPDVTVDAEIKLSRMRDGNERHAATCRSTYRALRGAGGSVAYNCGHHVHVDAQRIAECGETVAFQVIRAAAIVGEACDATLVALASSGFSEHRSQMGNEYGDPSWEKGHSLLEGRYAIHGSRLGYAVRIEQPGTATIEYRLPNGTLEPIRAHAHVAIALGLVDLAERAILDGDKHAAEILRDADGASYSQERGAAILAKGLRWHADSYAALAVASKSSPANADHVAVWERASKSPASV